MNEKILREIEVFFETIETKFLYRKNNIWSLAISEFLIFIYVICSIIILLPASKEAKNSYFISNVPDLFLSFFNTYLLENDIDSTITNRWIIGLSIILFGFFILFFYRRYSKLKMKKKGLSLHLWKFCIAFTVRNELKLYIINGENNHATNFNKYINWIEFPYSEFVPRYGSEKNPFSLVDITEQLLTKFKYLKFDDNSNFIIDTLKGLQSKVLDRAKYKTDIEVLKTLLDYQIILEFTKIKPSHIDADERTLSDNEEVYLMGFVNELKRLSKFEQNVDSIINEKDNLLKNGFRKIGSLFKSSNIYLFFLSWLLLFFVICFFALKIITTFNDIKIDSTIIVAYISIPIAASIAILNSPLRPK